MNKQDFTVFRPLDFLVDLEHEAAIAKKRIWIQSMYLEPGPFGERIKAIYVSPAAKDVDTRLHIDWYCLMMGKGEADKKAYFSSLQESGVKLQFTNPPDFIGRLWPYKGRNHMKMTIVDDVSYVGGLNFGNRDFGYADFMVKIIDPKITDVVSEQFLDVENGSLLEDREIVIDTNTKLFVDCGRRGKSIILRRACEAVSRAGTSIFHASQFVPDGAFLRELSSAYKRGVAIEATVPEKYDLDNVLYFINTFNRFAMTFEKEHIPLQLYPRMLHAKLTIIDEKIVLFGSHNLTDKGVQMGTAEIMIMSTNQVLAANLLAFYKDLGRE